MSAIRAAMPASRQRPFLRRLYGVGCFPRVFDITQAFIGFGLLGATPYQILHHVAGGILGARSYQMGWTSAVIGFVLHFTIAFTAPRLSNTRQARRKLPVLVEHAVCLQTAIWRSSIPIYVLCRTATFGFRQRSIQHRDLYHWHCRPHLSSWTADRDFRPAFRKA